MIVTTTPTVEGRSDAQYLGVVSAQGVLGVNVFKDVAASLAEKRDVEGLMSLFAPDYVDFEGRDNAGTVRLVTDYLDRYRGVVVHVLGIRMGEIGPDGRVDVECEIALSHGAAEVLRKLVRVGSEYYRFGFSLSKDGAGECAFTFAEWEAVGIPDLFPESLGILKKIFPDL